MNYDFLAAHLVSLPLTEALLGLDMHVLSLKFKPANLERSHVRVRFTVTASIHLCFFCAHFFCPMLTTVSRPCHFQDFLYEGLARSKISKSISVILFLTVIKVIHQTLLPTQSIQVRQQVLTPSANMFLFIHHYIKVTKF